MKAKVGSVLLAVFMALPLLGGEPSSAAVAQQVALEAPALRPSPIAVGAGLTWTSGEYRYDGSGNIAAIGATGTPGTHGARTYGYDAGGRLSRAHYGSAAGLPAVTHEYQHDPYGNRTAYAVNQQWVSVPVDPANNRPVDGTYDASGNQLARGATSAAYDGFGMVTRFRFDAVNEETFVYNANDERIGVLRGSEWTWSFRDAGSRVLRQYRSSATDPHAPWLWVEDFVYRGGLLLGSERAAADGGRRHYHVDHLGSPRLVTSGTGAVVSEQDFLPFGEERTAIGQQTARGFDRESPHRYTGHERDYDTAAPNDSSAYVDYMHARYYAPKTGRFLSVDPTWESADLGRPQSWNRYTYVMNNPVNATDPDGRVWNLLTPMTFRLGMNHPKSPEVRQVEKAALATAVIVLVAVATRGEVLFGPRAGESDVPAPETGGNGGSPRVKKMGPYPDAAGEHSTFKRSAETDRVSGYETYDSNGNPTKRFRGEGIPHGGQEPPLILEPKPGKGPGAKPIVPRTPKDDELPKGYDREKKEQQ